MPESPSSSFIPKRSPGKKPVTGRRSNFILLTVVSYALFVAAPLASAAVFIYERHTQNQFNKAVLALDEAITDFKEADLARVVAFDERLSVSKQLLGSHVSIVTLLRTIESETAESVSFKNLDLVRKTDATIEVSGDLSTPDFDGALFQRATYKANDKIKDPIFSDIKIVGADAEGLSASENTIEFKASFGFAGSDILYTPITSEVVSASSSDETLPVSAAASSTSTI